MLLVQGQTQGIASLQKGFITDYSLRYFCTHCGVCCRDGRTAVRPYEVFYPAFNISARQPFNT